MHQKKLVWRRLKEAGVVDSEDPRLQALVRYLHDHSADCWPDLIPAFREQFADCYDAVVPTLLEIDDPLIRRALITHADAQRPKEKALLETLATKVDADKDPVSLKRLIKRDLKGVNKKINRRSIPENLRVLLPRDQDDDSG